ncbi:MAG TPA: ATP-binding protein [Cyclobacteriaceae bacterium]|jgi:PAS domain S-box-containing protein|nr:ATP-binding protein [Cyclobacteriaceae bacterium]
MKFYFEKRVLAGFLCTIIALALLIVFSFSSTQRLIQTSGLLNHALSVSNTGDLVLNNILDMEASNRGYVVTGDSIFLTAVQNASNPLDRCLEKLDSLTASDSVQAKRVDSLHRFVEEKRAWSRHIAGIRKQGFEPARALIAEGKGRLITIKIRACIARLQFRENENFQSVNTIKANSLSQFRLSFIGLAMASFITIIYLFYVINQTLKARNEAEANLLQTVYFTRQDLEARVEDRNEKLAEINYIYRSLAANIPGTAITILDQDERYLLAEGDLLEKMGYIKTDMPGKKISEVITPKNYEYYEGLIHRAFAGETILVDRQTLSGYYTLMKVVPLKKSNDEIFAIMFVLIDVTEIKKIQVELADLNNVLESKVTQRTEQLIELNKELEAFTYSVSHDLRAPLRAISGYAHIIKEDYAPVLGDDGNRVSDLIISNAIRMGKLIDDLLSFSHLGRKEVSRAKINMNNLVSEVLKEHTIQEDSRKLNIKTLPLEATTGDVNMMRQVWVNLISNALKYTRKKEVADIEIGSFKEGDIITYYIRDNGAGFDMQYADKLFGVFQRLHKMNEFEGTGVGLALTQTIIKKHGGKIWAESKPNEGATFYFTLPTII